MSAWWLVVIMAAITVGSRVAALAVLPPPQGLAADVVARLPAPLFAALAAHSLATSDRGIGDPAMVVAACCALLAAVRWPSLLITLAAGLGGFLVASLIW